MARPSPIVNGYKRILGRISWLSALAAIGAGLLAAPVAHAQQTTYISNILYSFANSPDGANPQFGNLLKDSTGNLYGTTRSGGANGVGAVFELVNSSGTYTEQVLHSFGKLDGANPNAGLIMDAAGNLYGTTTAGGANARGTVFELVNSKGTYTEQVLYSFTTADAGLPSAGLIMDGTGNLYGTTSAIEFKISGNGIVFELMNSSGTYTEQVLHSFTGDPDGANPNAGLIMDAKGNLYGTTLTGGANNAGAVFELVNSSGTYTEQVLYSFASSPDGADPYAGLTMDGSGNLFGTTLNGGANGTGTVFELVNSSGTYTEQVLYSFANSPDGANPYAGLTMDGSGNLFGTTLNGGANGTGTVFELVNSKGTYTEGVLYSFSGSGSDGANPESGLIVDASGNYAGTTLNGGANGFGTVFEITPFSGTPFGTTTTLTSSPNPAMVGNGLLSGKTSPGLVLMASVTSSATSTPTGSIGFYDGATLLGTVNLSQGQAALSFEDAESAGGVGTFTLTAQYTPNTIMFSASAGNLIQTVNEPGVVLTSGNNTLSGTQTINGNIVIPVASGGVFSGNGSGLTGVNAATAAALTGNINDTQVNNLFTDLANTASSAVNTANTYANNTFLPLSGGTLTGALVGTSASFSGPLSGAGGFLLPPTNTATSSQGFNSGTFDAIASAFNSTSSTAQNQLFRWQSEPASNNTATPSATLNLLFGANGTAPSETGLSINANGTINFAAGQTFAGGGSGTITGVTAGTGLSGGGTSGNVTLNNTGLLSLTAGTGIASTGGQNPSVSLNTTFTDGRYLQPNGNGSGLTNLNPASLSVGTAGINILGNAATATTATNALALGGTAPSGYALIGTNNFTGNQTMPSESVTGEVTTGSIAIGGGTPIKEYVSVTLSVTLPALAPNACKTFTTAAITGFTPGTSDTIALGIPNSLTASLTSGVYLVWQPYETTTTTSPTLSLQVCNGSGTRLTAGHAGVVRLDVFKH